MREIISRKAGAAMSRRAGVTWQVILVLIALLALVTGIVLLWVFGGKADEAIAAIQQLFTFSWLTGG